MSATGFTVFEHSVESDVYPAPFCTTRGTIRSTSGRADGFALWNATARLEPGAEIEWNGRHGDEVLYVIEGLLEVDGRRCRPTECVIVESNVPAVVRALEPTRLVHSGPVDPEPPSDGMFGPPQPDGHGVHVMGAQYVMSTKDNPVMNEVVEKESGHSGSYGYFYADSRCPTCRITFLRGVSVGPSRTPSHTHSQDEIIHVVSGEIRVGRVPVRAGQSIAIPANYRYGFRSPEGFEFVNYRPDAQVSTFDPKKPGWVGTAEGLGMTKIASE